jgi:TPR repeat protein
MAMSSRKLVSRCWFAGLLTASLIASMTSVSVAQDTAPASAASATKVPSDTDLAAAHCVIGEERFLPGDYYYCLASQSYGLQRYEYAKKFFATAASWASKPAQYVLGVMALQGDHQPVNRPLALAWWTLASERPYSTFKAAHDALYAKSSRADRREAENLLTTMRATYADAVAAPRAEQRYTRGMADLARLDKGGSKFCLAGMSPASSPVNDPDSCPTIQAVTKQIDRAAVKVFDGWSGHVTVGPLQQVNTPSHAGGAP